MVYLSEDINELKRKVDDSDINHFLDIKRINVFAMSILIKNGFVNHKMLNGFINLLSDLENTCIIESVIPFPIIIIQRQNLNQNMLLKVCNNINNEDMRFILSCGIVNAGIYGSEKRFAYGSVGEPIDQIMEGLSTLPRSNSWLTMEAAKELEYHNQKKYVANDIIYVKYDASLKKL